jgi:hypothetical protein
MTNDTCDTERYWYLDRKRFTVHADQQAFIPAEALSEMEGFEMIEFYPMAKMRDISNRDGIREELDKLVNQVLTERAKAPEGSNTECIAVDMLTEFLNKLDQIDFRKIPIEKLIR